MFWSKLWNRHLQGVCQGGLWHLHFRSMLSVIRLECRAISILRWQFFGKKWSSDCIELDVNGGFFHRMAGTPFGQTSGPQFSAKHVHLKDSRGDLLSQTQIFQGRDLTEDNGYEDEVIKWAISPTINLLSLWSSCRFLCSGTCVFSLVMSSLGSTLLGQLNLEHFSADDACLGWCFALFDTIDCCLVEEHNLKCWLARFSVTSTCLK